MLLTISHQYIGAANINKIREMWLLVLPVRNFLPIGGTNMFPPIYWCNCHCYHQYIGGTVPAAPIYWWNMCSKIKKLLVFWIGNVSSTNNWPWCNIYTVWCVLFWRIFSQLQITFEDGGEGWGREGFLLAKYYAELLLIGCMAVWHGLIIKDNISPHGMYIC